MQYDVAPEHHLPAARGNLTLYLPQEPGIHPPLAFGRAEPLALAPAKVPGLVAADVESSAGEMGQQLIIKPAQKRQRARVIWRQR